ncbi:hypothetical protein K504DRAFT_508948 [Pleomassaria siparia CBS 279.74]|uniref:AMP-dependent synthetase/ligase domain-containing protein n=1 Tax=Pleomassaria siparia CBS 279.74 TaxID=1314801 RepID=A0A6G1JPJ6_9PLEO|nr:hypothetical protein K504DRAFT_508948 [Pleomassaria siparia CBS 279.74]
MIQIVVVAYLAATAGTRAVLLNTPSGLDVVAKWDGGIQGKTLAERYAFAYDALLEEAKPAAAARAVPRVLSAWLVAPPGTWSVSNGLPLHACLGGLEIICAFRLRVQVINPPDVLAVSQRSGVRDGRTLRPVALDPFVLHGASTRSIFRGPGDKQPVNVPLFKVQLIRGSLFKGLHIWRGMVHLVAGWSSSSMFCMIARPRLRRVSVRPPGPSFRAVCHV